MNDLIQAQRQAVIQEAVSWLGTPYHHAARVKGAGVDCGQILALVYEAAGITPEIVPDDYPHDWHMHRSEERYLATVERWAHKIDGPPEPGDIALFRIGRCISHGAIVVSWPTVIHAVLKGGGVVFGDVVADADLAHHLVGYWSPFGGSHVTR